MVPTQPWDNRPSATAASDTDLRLAINVTFRGG
jgi:hypothetical protein